MKQAGAEGGAVGVHGDEIFDFRFSIFDWALSRQSEFERWLVI
jgi:hypothetical protein